MRPRLIIAIDPGLKGGWASWDYTQGALRTESYNSDTHANLVTMLGPQTPNTRERVAYIEKVHASPQMGVSSAFTFGGNAKCWGLAMELTCNHIVHVAPQVWQKPLQLERDAVFGETVKERYKRRKDALKKLAQDRWPQVKVTLGTADALLLLHYAMEQESKH